MEKKSNRVLSAIESVCYKFRYLFLILYVALMVIVPFLDIKLVHAQVIILIGVYAMLGMGLNVLTATRGLVSLGHAGFYAIGAYTCALLETKLGVNFWLALVASGVLTAFHRLPAGPSLPAPFGFLSFHRDPGLLRDRDHGLKAVGERHQRKLRRQEYQAARVLRNQAGYV